MALYVPITPTTVPTTAKATAKAASSRDNWCRQIRNANRQGSTTATDDAMKEPIKDMTDAKKGTAMAVSTTHPSRPVRRDMDATVNFQLLCLTSKSSCKANTAAQTARTMSQPQPAVNVS